jgi:hypothetical protein
VVTARCHQLNPSKRERRRPDHASMSAWS